MNETETLEPSVSKAQPGAKSKKPSLSKAMALDLLGSTLRELQAAGVVVLMRATTEGVVLRVNGCRPITEGGVTRFAEERVMAEPEPEPA